MRACLVVVVCAVLPLGCYQGVDSGLGLVADGPSRLPSEGDGGGDGDSNGDDGGDDDDSAPADCEDGSLQIGATPLRRLTRSEYNATIRDLLGDNSAPADAFVDDEERGGYATNVSAVDPLQVDQYRIAAKDLSEAADLDTLVGCNRADSTCAASFIESFGARAYRRPLDDEELAAFVAIYDDAVAEWTADEAFQLLVQTMLMSPHFVYHVELGDPDSQRLSGYEVASRLSYFLWGTMPDDDLFTAADKGDLDGRAGIEAEARRMLEDDRASAMLHAFAEQWLHLGDVEEVSRDAGVFPDWDPALFAAMRAETETFLDEVVLRGDGKLETVLSAQHSYLDPDLAAHYGVTLGNDPMGRTELPPERAGLLTQGAVLVSHAYPTETSWVHRGKLVRERFLCGELPPPPPDVDADDTNDPDRLQDPVCSACHILMDPIGKGLDRYDATGRFRTEFADGSTIPAGGEVIASPIGKFDSVPDLAQALATDDGVRACVADQFGLFALGRHLQDEDGCSRDAVFTQFRDSDYNLRELMVAIVISDAFRHVP